MAIKNYKRIRESKNTITWRNEDADVNVLVFKNPPENDPKAKNGYGVEVDRGVGNVHLLTQKFDGTSAGQPTRGNGIGIAKRWMRKHPNG